MEVGQNLAESVESNKNHVESRESRTHKEMLLLSSS